MKRKFFALALMLLVLTGCSSNNTDKTKATEPMMAVTEPKAELGAVITAPVTKAPAAATVAPAVPPVTEAALPPAPAPTAPPAIIITKHPTSETVSAGGRTWFITNAENESQITWEFFSPDGTMYSLQQTMSAHPGLILEVLPEDTLGLRQIPASFNGWSARARYDGPGGTATTERATITVRTSSSTPASNPQATTRDPYSDVIETYRSVHRSGTGNIEKGISELVNTYDFVGYLKQDLDGNGVQELIIASDDYNSNYPYIIYEIYTIQNGKAVSVIKSAARERYFMLVDGTIFMEGSNSAMSSCWIAYCFSGASLSFQEQVFSSEDPHDLADFAPYFYYCGRIYGPEEPIPYDVAMRTIENWERTIWITGLTPIS